MPYSIVQMANEIYEGLGKPDEKTELSPTTTQRICTESLDDFNEKVGKWTFQLITHTANTQIYDMATLFPAIAWRKLRYLFNGDTIVDIEESGVTKHYLVTSEISKSLIVSGADIDLMKAITVSQASSTADFEFIEPSTVILLPPPDTDCLIRCVLQENYDIAVLPDKYYRIVREHAAGICQEIVGNARGRLNSVARTSEIARYTNREKYMYDRADRKDERFENECNGILIGRMKLVCVR